MNLGKDYMNTLVIVVHPNLKESKVNKRWLEELKKYNHIVNIHQLHEVYPDEKFDVKREQDLLLKHDYIFFQFPFYWFSYPPLLKKWMDEVLTYGFSYGNSPEDFKLEGKSFGAIVSTGIDESDYSIKGRYQHTLDELLLPFELTCKYIHTNMLPLFKLTSADSVSEELLNQSSENYIQHIKKQIKMG
jgi:putative NADPH-quinone reductase